MIDILIGLIISATLFYLLFYLKGRGIKLHAILIGSLVLESLLVIFWLEVILTFIKEDSLKGALVNGIVIGFLVAVFGILIFRFLLQKKLKKG